MGSQLGLMGCVSSITGPLGFGLGIRLDVFLRCQLSPLYVSRDVSIKRKQEDLLSQSSSPIPTLVVWLLPTGWTMSGCLG